MDGVKSYDAYTNVVLRAVFISLLLDLLGFTVILPLYPSILEFYKSKDSGNVYSSMEALVTSFRQFIGVPEEEDINLVLFGGMIGSLFSMMQFFNSPFFGAASDVYGRRPMIVTSLIGTTVSYLLWAVSDSFSLFILARIVAGISEANVSISTAAIADLETSKAKSKGMAVIGIAFSIAFVTGPLIGATFTKFISSSDNFFIAPAIFSVTVTLLDIVYILGNLPETLPIEKRASSVASSLREVIYLLNPISLFNFSAVRSTHEMPIVGRRLRRLGMIYFMYLFVFSGLEFTLTFLAHQRFHFTKMDQGKMFAVLGLTMAAVQGGYIRRKMAGKEKKLAMQAVMLLIPGFFIIGMSTTTTILYIGLMFFAFAAASFVPCVSALTASIDLESEKGRIMGILRSLGALARATGPVCASSSYWLIGAVPTYIGGGVLLLIPLALLAKLAIEKKKDVISEQKDK